MATMNTDGAETAPASADAAELMLIQFLSERDASCPLCQYNLRNLQNPRCPECGMRLSLSVATAEPLMKPWLLLVMPLVASAGFGMFFTIAMIFGGMPPLSWWPVAFGYIACIPAALIALRTRRQFLTLSHAVRRRIILTSITFCVVLMIWFVAVVAIHP